MAVRLKLKAGGTGIEICTEEFSRPRKIVEAGESLTNRARAVVRVINVIAEGGIEPPSPDYRSGAAAIELLREKNF